MPTEVTTEAAPAPCAKPTACLLHADFHVMGQDCWGVTLDWYFTHDHVTGQEARDAYQAAVERRMLDQLTREHNTPTSGAEAVYRGKPRP